MTRNSHIENSNDLGANPWRLRNVGRLLAGLMICGGVGLAAVLIGTSIGSAGSRRFLLAYLVAFAFYLSLSLGALFFLIVQHLSRAGWSILVRRPAEILAANFPVVGLMFVPIAVSVLSGNAELYPWAGHAQHVPMATPVADGHESSGPAVDRLTESENGNSELGPEKRAVLNPPFFVARWVLFLGLWSAMGIFFWRNSVQQDLDRAVERTARMERWAAPFAVLFGLSVTWAAFDLLMSLNPHWQSTMFGVYFFAGSVVGALALMILATIWLRQRGQLPAHVGSEHYLDFGRLLFGFVFFWGYIAFSQYMLLWYANIPLELTWLRDRGAATGVGQGNDWSWLLLFLLFGHLFIPFAGLMSRHIKRHPRRLAAWAIWLLICHFVDLVWIVLPEAGPRIQFGLVELGLVAVLGSVFLFAALLIARMHSLVPLGDPRIAESLQHESAY